MIIRKITPEWIKLGISVMDDFSSSVICKYVNLLFCKQNMVEIGTQNQSMPKCFHSFIIFCVIKNGERKTEKEIFIGILLIK